jgi:hypothetical protein
MNKLILIVLLLFSTNVFAEGFSFVPNEQIVTSGWVDGKYQTKTTIIDSTGKQATTSGWQNNKYVTETTVIDTDGNGATTSGWQNGKYVTKRSTFQK